MTTIKCFADFENLDEALELHENLHQMLSFCELKGLSFVRASSQELDFNYSVYFSFDKEEIAHFVTQTAILDGRSVLGYLLFDIVNFVLTGSEPKFCAVNYDYKLVIKELDE